MIHKKEKNNVMSEVVPKRCRKKWSPRGAEKLSWRFCKYSQNEDAPVLDSLSNNVAGPQPVNFIIIKRLQHMCFPANFAKFSRTPSWQDPSGWVLLVFTSWVLRSFSEHIFYRTILIEGRLLISFLSCRISASIHNNYFTVTFQALYKNKK